MQIDKIVLNDFRNYKELTMGLDQSVNILVGKNAQGKTNILEAIYFCATARSHRTNYEKETIRWGSDEAHIQLNILKEHSERIDIHLKSNGKKGIAVNKLPIQKLSQLFGILNVVMFSPEDLQLIKSGPRQRRRFLDIELCQLDPIYLYNLQQYHKILKQRNNLLKSIKYNRDLLDTIKVWDIQLSEYANKVVTSRIEFVESLEKWVKKIHGELTNGVEQISIKYDTKVNEGNLLTQLERQLEKDIKFGNTSIGPHRDDLVFLVNGIDIRVYGSQGQQRTVALSLKLAEIELVKEIKGDTPVLLLDDVFSELDKNRQDQLLNYIEGVQTIITCTGVEDIIQQKKTYYKIINIHNGKIIDC